MTTSRQTIPKLRLEPSRVFLKNLSYSNSIPKLAISTTLNPLATSEFFSTVTIA